MRNIKLYAKFVMLALILSVFYGCAAGARMEKMIYTNDSIAEKYDPALKKQISLEVSKGGEETNPMWMSKVGNFEFTQALKQSLKNMGLLAENNGTYKLEIQLLDLVQPFAGFDMTVKSRVLYKLTDQSGKEVFKQAIQAEHTATVSDAFLGYERLQIANEGSAKNNIGKFLETLSKFQINPQQALIVN